jgi:L-rhamnose-H+ transport protein
MLVLNWALAVTLLHRALTLYQSIPRDEFLALALFGTGWGIGAVLFGIGMDRLGLTLGYPLIMGLNAATGATVPLLLSGGDLLSAKSAAVLGGTALAIAGLVTCSVAGARKQAKPGDPAAVPSRAFAPGLTIALAAGLLCCLPNVGMSHARETIAVARSQGASDGMAANAVWAVFFTFGGLVNLAYCLALALRRKTVRVFVAPGAMRDLGLSAAMAVMWIGSFYLYGLGAARLGGWGAIIGWPVFISLAIAIGTCWGLRSGEWSGAPSSALRLLAAGLSMIVLAVGTLAASSVL